MFTGVAAGVGGGGTGPTTGQQQQQQPQILIPTHVAQYVSNASSTELTVLHNFIKYHLDNRNLPFTRHNDDFEFFTTTTTTNGAWTRPLIVVPATAVPAAAAARSPLLPQQQIPIQTPPVQEPEKEQEEKEEEEKREKVDKRKLHVYRPKDSDWDWKTFRDEVIRALDHDKPISHIFCPKKASYVSIDFTESHYKGKDGFELAEEGAEKLRAKDFRVEFSILREKKKERK